MITKPSLARNIRPLEDDFFGKSKDKTVNVTREKLAKIYHDNLKGITVEELVDMLTNKLIEIPQYLALLQGGNTCKKTSLLFNPHRLAINTAQGKNNFIESLKDDRFFLGLARVSLFHWNHGGNDQGLLDFLLGFGINGTTFAYEFPPHVARNLCKEFGVRMTDKVLDPCAGWGGRMLGISVVCNNYICYEPCSRTAGGLNKLHKFIQSFNPDFTARIRCAPFEDATLPNDFFDFAITSPPYYNTEKYSDELTNSCNRYLTFDSWCAGFYATRVFALARRSRGCLLDDQSSLEDGRLGSGGFAVQSCPPRDSRGEPSKPAGRAVDKREATWVPACARMTWNAV